MIEERDRLYHCHKIKKHITIFEDYEIVDGERTLIKCECPVYKYGENGKKCNGLNDHGFTCGYANYNLRKE